MTWDPPQYMKFVDERTRPASDLLHGIAVAHVGRVYDLGCGPGNSTALLARRWPEAIVTGIDNDSAMLSQAMASYPRFRWLNADVGAWVPAETPDVIFSNAALQWVDHHALLFPRLASFLPEGGVLAVQMPSNYDQPTHRFISHLARQKPWDHLLVPLLREVPVAPPEAYYRWLIPHVHHLTVWETTYLQSLAGGDPVLSWVRGTALRPLLEALPPDWAASFERTLGDMLLEAYPPESDGRTLLPFRRLFLVAVR